MSTEPPQFSADDSDKTSRDERQREYILCLFILRQFFSSDSVKGCIFATKEERMEKALTLPRVH